MAGHRLMYKGTIFDSPFSLSSSLSNSSSALQCNFSAHVAQVSIQILNTFPMHTNFWFLVQCCVLLNREWVTPTKIILVKISLYLLFSNKISSCWRKGEKHDNLTWSFPFWETSFLFLYIYVYLYSETSKW